VRVVRRFTGRVRADGAGPRRINAHDLPGLYRENERRSIVTIHHTTFLVDVLDVEGYPEKQVGVEVEYVTERDNSYGADADGRRGVVREEAVEILDVFIPGATLLELTSANVEQVLRDVRAILQQRRQHA
jgi:hypothetical protein